MSPTSAPERPGRIRSALRRAGSAIAVRVVRTRPDWILPSPRAIAIGAWVTSVVVACLTLLPVSIPAIPSEIDVAPLVLDAPAWFRIVAYLAAGVLAATIVAWALLVPSSRLPGSPVRAALLVAAAAAGGLLPALALAEADRLVLAITAVAFALGATVWGLTLALRASAGGWPTAFVATAAAVPWVLGTTTAGDTDAVSDPFWIAFSIVAVQAALIVAYFGYSSGGVQRTTRMRPLLERERSRTLVTVVLGIAVFVLVARLTFARDLFATPEPDDIDEAALWSLRSPASWPLTLVIAGLIVWAALRSERQSLRSAGFRRILLLLTAGYAVGAIALMVASVDLLVAPLMNRGPIDVGFVADWLTPIRVIAAVLLVLFVVVPRFRRTSGRWIAGISLVYLVPGLTAPLVEGVWPEVPAYWATPVPVVVALTGIVAVIVAGQWFGAFGGVSRSALLRLLVYPVIVLHAAALVPAALSGSAALVAVLLLLAQFFLLMPKVAADRIRHSRVVLFESAAALFALIALLLAAQSGAWQMQATVFAMLTLAVPVMTALVIRADPSDRALEIDGAPAEK